MVEAPPVGPALPPRRRKGPPSVTSAVARETEHTGKFLPVGKEELYLYKGTPTNQSSVYPLVPVE